MLETHDDHPILPNDLPELPPTPPYPCPFLTDEEVKTYLEPLYLHYWTVQPSNPEQSKKPAPELVKSFTFASASALSAFLDGPVQWVESHENVCTCSPDSLACLPVTYASCLYSITALE